MGQNALKYVNTVEVLKVEPCKEAIPIDLNTSHTILTNVGAPPEQFKDISECCWCAQFC